MSVYDAERYAKAGFKLVKEYRLTAALMLRPGAERVKRLGGLHHLLLLHFVNDRNH